ncbi:MAG: SLC13 family permease [Nitrososphaerales archaeon]
MTIEIALLLLIVVVALVLFSFEWAPPDVTALGILLTLVLTGLLPADQAFAGFGSETVLMLLGLLILTAALVETGVVDLAGRVILRRASANPDQILAIVMLAGVTVSSFISNTAATAFLLPVVTGVAARLRISASRFLMPLAFGSILASSVTLVATSTNIVVSGMLVQHQMPPIGVFELTPVGLPIALAGLVYMLTLGRRLMPERHEVEALTDEFQLRPYITEIRLLSSSPLAGKTLAQSAFAQTLGVTALAVLRDGARLLAPGGDTKLMDGDTLLVQGQRDAILKLQAAKGIEVHADAQLSDRDLQADDTRLVEAVVLPGSPFIGRSLQGLGLREKHGLQMLALNRISGSVHDRLSEVRLRMGDVLLLQGRQAELSVLEEDNAFRVLGVVETKQLRPRRTGLATALFAGALILGASGVLSLAVAALLGALLAFLTRCITPEEAYRRVEWRALILIACMLGLGAALQQTGAAGYLAAQIVRLAGWAHPAWLLGGFFVLTVLLTQPMSNQAAAALLLPVALQAAAQTGLNPRPFAMMVAVAASCSYLTPLEPACLLVYGPGRYRFRDFLKVGAPLTLLIFGIAMALVPRIWPLAP